MNKQTIIVLGLMLCSNLTIRAQHNNPNRIKNNDKKCLMTTSFNDNVKRLQSQTLKDEENILMRPTKEDVYSLHQGDWFLESNNEYEYDSKGRRIKEILTRRDDMGQDVHTRFTLNYNEDSMLADFIEEYAVGNQNWIKLRKTVNTYDAIRKDIQIKQTVYEWDESIEDWTYVANDIVNMYREVERDTQGRITLNQMWKNEERTTPYTGFEFAYGESGAATSMDMYIPDEEGYLTKNCVFEDLVWHKSDCQYLKMSDNLYHAFTKDPNNRITSYTLYAYDEEGNKSQWLGNYKAKYDDQYRLIRTHIRLPYDNGVDQKYVAEIAYDTDGIGSEQRLEKNWVDDNDNDIYDFGETLISAIKLKSVYDDKGNPICIEWYEGDATGEYHQVSGYKYETIYTDFDAIEQRITYSYNPELREYEYLSKVIYSDFINVAAGIETAALNHKTIKVYDDKITTENMNGCKYKIFDIEGRVVKSGIINSSTISIANYSKGMYLIRVFTDNDTFSVKIIK